MATAVKQEKIGKWSTSRLKANALTYFLLITGSALVLVPFVWMVSSSLKDPGEIFKQVRTLRDVFPAKPLWGNYPEALKFMNFTGCLRNTCVITFFAMAGQIMSASLVAFGFARMRFPGRDVLFIVLLATIMLPPQVTLIPIFKIFTTLGWYDTFFPLTVPAFFGGGVFAIFLLRQYYMTIPIEMDEAAKIDGAGTFGIFTKVILPQVKPALGTVAIFSFMGHWNDFLGPLIYLSDPAKRTLALALYAFQGEHATDWHLLMAAATVVMLPLLTIFFCAQKYFIQGVVISGVKG
jgi:multiple sugar transport system permease protein